MNWKIWTAIAAVAGSALGGCAAEAAPPPSDEGETSVEVKAEPTATEPTSGAVYSYTFCTCSSTGYDWCKNGYYGEWYINPTTPRCTP